ncbi:MAG: hypothetical protein LBT75_01275 [Bacilli bacterium]|nr:hypothetical protein [Bacilli bacterium]
MNIIFNTNEFGEQSFETSKINYFFSYNNSGKTLFSNIINNGFSGIMKKSFIYNGEIINKDDFIIYYIGDLDTMENEKNLNSKSLIKNSLDFALDTLEEDTLIKLNNLTSELNVIINDCIISNIETIAGIQLKVSFDFDKLINKNSFFTINDNELSITSFSVKRTKYFNLILNEIKRNKVKTVLIIDELFLGLDDRNSQSVLNQLIDLGVTENCLIFFTGSKIFTNNNNINILFLNDNKINSFRDDFIKLKMVAEFEDISIDDCKRFYYDEEVEKIINKNQLIELKMKKIIDRNY